MLPDLRHWFRLQVLEEVPSRFSGPVRVIKSGRSVYLSTGQLTQSGGLVADVWKPVIKKISKTYYLEPKTCLILGLAGGTLADILARTFPGIRITGVEIDPVMLSLGRKYLSLDKIPNLQIIQSDADFYISSLKSHFDYLLVDLYIGDQIPEFVYSEKFLGQLGKLGQLVIFNHLFYDPAKREKAGYLTKKLGKYFTLVRLHRVLTNLMIICSQKQV